MGTETVRSCSAIDCFGKHYARGLCVRCYKKLPDQKEKSAKRQRERYASDPEYALTVKRGVTRRRADNPDQAQAHRDREAARRKQPGFNERVRPYFREHARRYRAEHPEYTERMRAKHREWSKANPETCRAHNHARKSRQREVGGSYTAPEWQTKLDEFGHTCPACGSREKLTVDHIIPLTWGGPSYIWNLQPLCLRCNSSKRNSMIIAYSPRKG